MYFIYAGIPCTWYTIQCSVSYCTPRLTYTVSLYTINCTVYSVQCKPCNHTHNIPSILQQTSNLIPSSIQCTLSTVYRSYITASTIHCTTLLYLKHTLFPCPLYTVQCTAYIPSYLTTFIVHCTLFTAQCTLYIIHSTYIIQRTLYTKHQTLFRPLYTIHNIDYTSFTIQCNPPIIHGTYNTPSTIQYALYNVCVMYTVHHKYLYTSTVHRTLYTKHQILLRPLYTVQCTMYTIQCAMYNIHCTYLIYKCTSYICFRTYTVHRTHHPILLRTLYTIHCSLYTKH